MKTVVALTVNDRPHYLVRVLDAWVNVRGIQNSTMVFQVEPNSPSLRVCYNAPFKDRYVVVNTSRQGALGNPYAALDTGFDLGADFVVLGEDDSIVTADVLEYFSFAAKTYEHQPKCLAVCTFQFRPFGPAPVVHPRHYFASVVWGTWRNRWEEQIRPEWTFGYHPAWDRMLLDKVVAEQYCAFPGISRSQHIGREGGTHMKEGDFEELQAKQLHDGSVVQYIALVEGENVDQDVQ
jgi:GNT-I family protein